MIRSVVALVVLCGCSSSLPQPPRGERPTTDDYIVVPYPPPPARVEIIPQRPPDMSEPVWVDGEWTWQNRRWVWKPGRWKQLVRGEYYTPPMTVALADGMFAFYPGQWHVRPVPK